MWIKRLGLLLVLAASPAFGAARHVYLNSTGGGTQLNDCPNPVHAFDTTSNASELFYCNGSNGANRSVDRVICDPGGSKICKSLSVTTTTCNTDGGAAAAVTNGIQINIEATGVLAPQRVTVYGHPQACVWNMAPSDSCEVHAGTYKRGGTISDWNAAGATGVVDRSDCWIATVAALGHGSNGTIGTNCPTSPTSSQVCGYGSLSSPAFLRGAVMNGSTDTWDSNGNKIPDVDESVTSYPAIFNGDADLDGITKEATSCNANAAVNGDAFYPLMWGCGGSGAVFEVCQTTISGAETRPFVDTDANGTFDTMLPGGPRDVSHFVIKDIEATGYGGGPTSMTGSGIREKLGHFSIGGDGSSGGFVADHVYFHDNGRANVATNEHYCAIFGDDEDAGCHKDHEIKNSNLMLNNRFVINDDSDSWDPGSSESGCGWYMHDNKIDVVTKTGCSPSTNGDCRQGLIRFKSVDTLQSGARKKQIRISNNDVTWETASGDAGGNAPWFIHTECIGTCGPHHLGLGEFWFYGNIMHYRSGSVNGKPFGGNSCNSDGSPDDHQYRLYVFNNTWDASQSGAEATNSFGAFCNSAGEISVSKNNAFYKGTSVNTTTADTTRYTSNICTESGQTGCTQNNTNGSGGTPRTGWWTVGTWGVAANSTPANYIPRTGGPLDGTGSCDPDGDGVAGVDYDDDGVNDTTWTDLAGNVVSCPTVGTAIDIGAVQNSSAGGGPVCGNNLIEGSEVCDGTALNGQTCVSQGFLSGTLTCNAGCTAFDTTACVGAVRAIKRGVIKRGVVVR